MATKSEKAISMVLGTIIGVFSGYIYDKRKNFSENITWIFVLLISVVGGLIGYLLSLIFGTPNDTVNYQLFNGNKRVYHGITYVDRIDNRMSEHIRDGKIFTKMVIDDPKPRTEAMALEEKLIKEHRPIYNIQHNNPK